MAADAIETWYADDFLLTQKLVYDVELRDGLYAVQSKKGDQVDLPSQHGTGYRERPFQAGAFVLNMWIGSQVSRQEVDQWWESVIQATVVPHRLVRFQRTKSDGTLRECYGEVAQGVEPAPEGGGLLLRCGIAVDVPAAFWQDTTDSTVATAAGAALPQNLACTAFAPATMPMPYNRYQITGPISNPSVQVIDDYTGAVIETWSYLGTLAAGQTLLFDSATWVVQGGGGYTADPSLVRHTGPKFLTMRPAGVGRSPQLRLTGGNGGAGTRLIMTGRNCYGGGG